MGRVPGELHTHCTVVNTSAHHFTEETYRGHLYCFKVVSYLKIVVHAYVFKIEFIPDITSRYND